jgi:UDP-glucuronate 4-epimerase
MIKKNGVISSMKILVTGGAGFIGMSCARHFLERGDEVVVVDNLSDYYDVNLKKKRIQQLQPYSNFSFFKGDIRNMQLIADIFSQARPNSVVHLAAQAGVRHSLTHPASCIENNISGFLNILEGCRLCDVQHLVYASSSSVYGGNELTPFSEEHSVDHPLSLYAATKKTNELMAHAYSYAYDMPTTGLRFFTVYGPWGRPDMALFLFANAIVSGEPIDIFNHGEMSRDFTFIDDVVEAVTRVLDKPATPLKEFDKEKPNPSTSLSPFRVFNVGNGSPAQLMDYVYELERGLGIKAKKNYLPMQLGDMVATSADNRLLADWIGIIPNTSITVGVKKFVDWYQQFYK